MNVLSKTTLLACTALALGACGGNDVADALNIGSPRARVVNAIVDGPSVQVYRNSDLQSDAGTLAYAQSSKYFDTVETTSTWSLRDASSGTRVGSTSLRTAGSTRYTLVAVAGSSTQADLLQVSDPYDFALGTDKARVRIVNASSAAGTVDVYLSAVGADIASLAPTLSAVAYEGASPASGSNSYTLSAGSYELRLTAAGSKTVLFDGTLSAGEDDDLLLVTLPKADGATGIRVRRIPTDGDAADSDLPGN
ncbi:MAG: DUF4397 domain-containing protein [Betaproteobacteria bacterium]